MTHTVVLTIHIAAGAAGLVLGPLAVMSVTRRRGWYLKAGLGYRVAVGLVCATTLGLVVLNPSFWPLGLIAGATETAALAGWVMMRRQPPGWVHRSIRLTGSSYIALVTALVVVSTLGLAPGSFLAGLVPILVGRRLVERTARLAHSQDACCCRTAKPRQPAWISPGRWRPGTAWPPWLGPGGR